MNAPHVTGEHMLTLSERVVLLEAAHVATLEVRRDVESRLRRIERTLWGIVALQLGLKYLL